MSKLSEHEKFLLILEAAKAASEMESRGRLMEEHQPTVKIVLEEFHDMYTSTIELHFPDGRVGKAANWGGMGHTIGEALDANLLCLKFEMEERIAKLQAMLAKLTVPVDEAFPPKKS